MATKHQVTRTRLAELVRLDVAAGRKVRWLEVDDADRASLIAEIRNENGPLAKQMKAGGIDVALTELAGVPVRWQAAATRTQLKEVKEPAGR